jgi:hypothetical protein
MGRGGGGGEIYSIVHNMYLFVKNLLIIVFQLEKAGHN